MILQGAIILVWLLINVVRLDACAVISYGLDFWQKKIRIQGHAPSAVHRNGINQRNNPGETKF